MFWELKCAANVSGEGQSVVGPFARSTIFLQNYVHALACSFTEELRCNTLKMKETFLSVHYDFTHKIAPSCYSFIPNLIHVTGCSLPAGVEDVIAEMALVISSPVEGAH